MTALDFSSDMFRQSSPCLDIHCSRIRPCRLDSTSSDTSFPPFDVVVADNPAVATIARLSITFDAPRFEVTPITPADGCQPQCSETIAQSAFCSFTFSMLQSRLGKRQQVTRKERLRRGNVLYDPRDDNHHPAQRTSGTLASLEVTLNIEYHDRHPEDYLEKVDDEVYFQGCPFLETLNVFSEELVGDEDKGLGSLYHCVNPMLN